MAQAVVALIGVTGGTRQFIGNFPKPVIEITGLEAGSIEVNISDGQSDSSFSVDFDRNGRHLLPCGRFAEVRPLDAKGPVICKLHSGAQDAVHSD